MGKVHKEATVLSTVQKSSGRFRPMTKRMDRNLHMPLDRILRRPAVEDATGLSRSTLYDMIASGTFPKPMRLGERAVGWRESQIAAWLDERSNDQQ